MQIRQSQSKDDNYSLKCWHEHDVNVMSVRDNNNSMVNPNLIPISFEEEMMSPMRSVINVKSSSESASLANMQSPNSTSDSRNWSEVTRRRRWRHLRREAVTVVKLFCCSLILIANHKNAAAATGSNDRSNQQVIVFPGIRSNASSSFVNLQLESSKNPHARNDYSASTIYVNPNPSTRSRRPPGPGTSTSGQPSSGSLAPISRPLNSIGKDERSQVAEWPFFKSLQVVRSHQQQSMIGRKLQMAGEEQQSRQTTSPPPATMTTPSMMVSLMKQLTPAAKRVFSNGHTSEDNLMSSTPAPKDMDAPDAAANSDATSDQSMMAGTTTMLPQPMSAYSSESDASDMSSDTPAGGTPAAAASSMTSATTTTSTTTTTTTSTTTPAPEAALEATTTTTTPAPVPAVAMDPLFVPDFHSSVQQAVNRLAKLGAAAAGSSRPDEASASPGPKQSEAAIAAKQVSGRAKQTAQHAPATTTSSLSLNVLLRNFGVFNLTDLDQILLRSIVRNKTNQSVAMMLNKNSGKHSKEGSAGTRSRLPIVSDEFLGGQHIAINGVHKLHTQSGGGDLAPEHPPEGYPKQLNATNDVDSAECKIEYTMKHVNITLMNTSERDYTCDYIIDRKLEPAATSETSTGLQADAYQAKLVCKLRLISRFFSNESTAREDASCNGTTYLSVGSQRFCYLFDAEDGASGDRVDTLDRVFSFPIQRDAFDIRLVHRRSRQRLGDFAIELHDDLDIQLEIKPIVDSDCRAPVDENKSAGAATISSSGASEAAVSSGGPANEVPATTTTTPAPTQSQSQSQRLNRRKPPQQQQQPRRPFPAVVRRPLSPSSALRSQQQQDNHQVTTTNDNHIDSQPSSEPELCDPNVPFHGSTIGQLTSPEYPNYYPADIHCKLVIRRASEAYCKLLLHFRDFDLVSSGDGRDECRSDYVKIGSTRYCNRYAMIGHKMMLSFAGENITADLAATESITLAPEEFQMIFHSDSMQGGRGFLVKYQQLACDGEDEAKIKPPQLSSGFGNQPKYHLESKSTTAIGELEPTPAPPVRVPMQQPDFGLAHRTTRAPVNPTSPSNNQPAQAGNSSGSSGSSSSSKKLSPLLQIQASTVSSSFLNNNNNGDRLPTTLSVDQSSQCSLVRDEMSFLLKSPNYPRNYPNNSTCSYYIKRNNSRICYVELTFIRFDLEADSESEDCRYDYFEINNVRLCGSLRYNDEALLDQSIQHKITRIYLFNEPIKMIKFRTDAKNTKSGFLIRVDQLECAPNGSILRGIDLSPYQPATATNTGTDVGTPPTSGTTIEYGSNTEQKGQSSNATHRFHYDSATTLTTRHGSNKQAHSDSDHRQQKQRAKSLVYATASSDNGEDEPGAGASTCNAVFYDNEFVIKSPNWPESYSNDKTLSVCKYTIVRSQQHQHQQPRKSICQLELQFVQFKLGSNDCLDIDDGHEILCGFSGRNLFKYYTFDRQPYLSITFTTSGFETASNKVARSSKASSDNNQTNHSDLLPLRSAPSRFMIVGRQNECIDGFLAPQVDLDPSPPLPDQSQLRARTHGKSNNNSSLLYTSPSLATVPVNLMVSRSNRSRTSASHKHNYDRPLVAGPNKPQPEAGSLSSPPNRLLTYSTPIGHLDQSPQQVSRHHGQQQQQLPVDFGSAGHSVHRPGRQQLLVDSIDSKLIDRMPLAQYRPLPTTDDHPTKCSLSYAQYNGVLTGSGLISRASSGKLLSSLDRLIDCELNFRLLPGYCKLQLTFVDFDMFPRRRSGRLVSQGDEQYGNVCAVEYFELNQIQYCGSELRNTSHLLAPVQNGDHPKVVSVRVATSNVHSFRAIFKQFECEPSPLGVGQQLDNNNSNRTGTGAGQSANHKSLSSHPGQQHAGQSLPQAVDFKEIVLKGDFFQIDSSKLPKSALGANLSNANQYAPNQFVVYRLKRLRPQVCKVRLLFYRFDLEPSLGCRSDFLDVNNVDRLCGQLDQSTDSSSTSRTYEWRSTGDFVISFVSDASDQRNGFHLFGQQLSSDEDCNGRTTSSRPNQDQVNRQNPVGSSDSPTPAPTNRDRDKDAKERAQDKQCSRLLQGVSFELSSPNWPQRYDRGQCHYLISRLDQSYCSVTFNIVSFILDLNQQPQQSRSDCAELINGSPTSDYLDLDGHLLCGILERPRSIEIAFGRRQFIGAKFVASAASGFGFFIEARQNRCTAGGTGQISGESDEPKEGDSDSRTQTKRPASKSDESIKPMAPESHTSQRPTQTQTGTCNRLITDQVALIESDLFPVSDYPHNSECLYVMRRSNVSVCAIDVQMSNFELEPEDAASGSCENDYLEIDYSRFCGTYPSNHRLRFNYFGDELDKLIRFHSDAAVARKGFSLIVSHVRGADCLQSHLPPGPVTTSPTNSPPASATTTPAPTPATAATQSPSYERAGGDDHDDVIAYLPDSSTRASLGSTSTTTAATTRPNSISNTGQQTISPQPEATLCQFVFHRERHLLVSPNYSPKQRTYDNNLDCQYKVIAAGYEYCSLRLRLIDLDLELANDCSRDYLLIDNRRYCGNTERRLLVTGFDAPAAGAANNVSDNQTTIEIPFSDNLPREVDLLLHTDAHTNDGRGFKLLYEQVPCDASPTPLTSGQARIDAPVPGKQANNMRSPQQPLPTITSQVQRSLRRQHFGQLSYPRNYVSSATGAESEGTAPSARATGDRRPTRSSGALVVQPDGVATDGASEGMTLKREIVVVKPVPIMTRSFGTSLR